MRKLSVITIYLVASAICAHAQAGMTKTQDAKLIADIKQMSVSELDPTLPRLGFEKWLRVEAGADPIFSWEVNDCGEQTGSVADRGRDIPVCVEVDASMKDGRNITILVAVGTTKKVPAGRSRLYFSQLTTPGETIQIRKLGDLPAALVRTHRLVSYPEIAQ